MQTIVNLVSGGLGVAWVPESVHAVPARRRGLPRAAEFAPAGAATGRRRCRAARPAWSGRPPAPTRRWTRFVDFVRSSRRRGRRLTRCGDCAAQYARCSCTRRSTPSPCSSGPIAIHWYGLTYLAAFGAVLFPRHAPPAARAVRARSPAPGAWTRKDVEDIAVPRRAGRDRRRPAGLLPVLQARLLPRASAGDLLRLAGRHELPRRAARRDRRRWCWFARSRAQAVLAGDGFRRALRADRAGGGPRRQLHQRRAVGPLQPAPTCPGAWCSRRAARCCRAIRRRSTSSCSKGCCCS